MIDDQLRELAAARERFACILADPPWAFETRGRIGWAVPQTASVQHYATMQEHELTALPVVDVAADNALMVMWVLDTHIDQAMRIGAAWGFTYKTMGFVWHKMSKGGLTYMGLGHWLRSGGEVSLLFTRGNPKRLDQGARQFIHGPVREHSRKPEATWQRMEALVAGPRLELFGRQRRRGWTVVGNEVDKFAAVR